MGQQKNVVPQVFFYFEGDDGMVKNERKKDDISNSSKIAMRVSAVSIVGNCVLSLLKFLAGIFAHSGAMISDAVHSLSDVLSTFIVMIGISVAKKKPDKDHPYGHERFECVASIVLAVILAVTGLGIGLKGTEKILSANTEALEIPETAALIAAVVSIIVKEAMFQYTKKKKKKINSGALMADAWHHRSDALSSIGAFIGIFGAMLGFPVLDPLASVIICVFIEKAAIDIFRDAIDKMIDKSCSEEIVENMKKVILDTPEVIGVDEIKTRLFGSRIYVEVEICMENSKTLIEAHSTAEKVHDNIEENFPEVKHCMVHVNPSEIE